MTNERVLTLSAVEAGYGQGLALHGIDLEVSAGELVVVIGPNGHGKTTLLRTISGLLTCSRGTIDYKGTRISDLRTEKIVDLGLTQIPQGDLLFPDMTVQENLLLGSFRPAAHKKRAARLEIVFELFPRLRERRTQRARTLSGGERRMVALGRGLMSDADTLLIDEPSLGLAPVLVHEVYERIASIAASGITVLLVEENVTNVRDVADRLLLMESGRIVMSGTPDEVLSDASVMRTYLGVGE
ncbi:MAG: ABC transporter ATP-binding protein [Candidatus Nanopelagicales bacterium]